ncbi:hypothetical protein HPB47_023755, partial [Ixodes persulcatus]
MCRKNRNLAGLPASQREAAAMSPSSAAAAAATAAGGFRLALSSPVGRTRTVRGRTAAWIDLGGRHSAAFSEPRRRRRRVVSLVGTGTATTKHERIRPHRSRRHQATIIGNVIGNDYISNDERGSVQWVWRPAQQDDNTTLRHTDCPADGITTAELGWRDQHRKDGQHEHRGNRRYHASHGRLLRQGIFCHVGPTATGTATTKHERIRPHRSRRHQATIIGKSSETTISATTSVDRFSGCGGQRSRMITPLFVIQ